MKLILVLVGAFVVLALASCQAEAAYKHINQYLVDKVNSQDVSSNMKAAVELLKEEETSKRSVFARNRVPDLKKFTALQQVIDNPKCDGSDYEIMKANEAVTNLHKLNDDSKVLRRLDNVMLQIFKEHAQKCQSVYSVVYKTKKEQFDAKVFESVAELGTTIIEHLKLRRPAGFYSLKDPRLLFGYIIKRPAGADSYVGEGVYQDAIIRSAEDDPNVKYARKTADEITGKLVVHKDKIKQLVTDYLIKPCKQYVDTFGPDLFVPARFDSRVYFNMDLDNLSFYRGWEYFKICQGIVEDETTVYNDVVKSAN